MFIVSWKGTGVLAAAELLRSQQYGPIGNGELILVVWQAAICEVKTSLETYDYKVLTASDGIEAIALPSIKMKLVVLDDDAVYGWTTRCKKN